MQIDIINTSSSYAGDVDPKTAWSILENYNQSLLVDVRTKAELSYVGYPDLSSLKKSYINVEQQFFPDGNLNENFVKELEGIIKEQYSTKDCYITFLCRSGARSARAAAMMAEQGWINCYNIAYGFEGDPDEFHHRAKVNGWKYEGLPWIQQ
ncbi:MAG: sulfurtransferase [Rhodobiaceae bacterium]|nr:sulfurtransferase [Rhodobiaceae bacterium]MDC3085030.1 rhodanese-like domain-containing protein [Gammaproteobacteria bacterium]|tara:strand:- start:7771 stop:8226 length:456 start_codon:yes stop_codon:yes gene_type:complete